MKSISETALQKNRLLFEVLTGLNSLSHVLYSIHINRLNTVTLYVGGKHPYLADRMPDILYQIGEKLWEN